VVIAHVPVGKEEIELRMGDVIGVFQRAEGEAATGSMARGYNFDSGRTGLFPSENFVSIPRSTSTHSLHDHNPTGRYAAAQDISWWRRQAALAFHRTTNNGVGSANAANGVNGADDAGDGTGDGAGHARSGTEKDVEPSGEARGTMAACENALMLQLDGGVGRRREGTAATTITTRSSVSGMGTGGVTGGQVPGAPVSPVAEEEEEEEEVALRVNRPKWRANGNGHVPDGGSANGPSYANASVAQGANESGIYAGELADDGVVAAMPVGMLMPPGRQGVPLSPPTSVLEGAYGEDGIVNAMPVRQDVDGGGRGDEHGQGRGGGGDARGDDFMIAM
ncbi:hypothetical protein HK101_005451, partial [Irineochytrium annulatum]